MQLTGINMDSPKYKETALSCDEQSNEEMETLKPKENAVGTLAVEQA
jgi:hypothetical protein